MFRIALVEALVDAEEVRSTGFSQFRDAPIFAVLAHILPSEIAAVHQQPADADEESHWQRVRARFAELVLQSAYQLFEAINAIDGDVVTRRANDATLGSELV